MKVTILAAGCLRLASPRQNPAGFEFVHRPRCPFVGRLTSDARKELEMRKLEGLGGYLLARTAGGVSTISM
jgi:hypothetical protein